MARIFVAVPQYRVMPEIEVGALASDIGMKSYYEGYGMHPVVSEMLLEMQADSNKHQVDVFFNYGDACLERARTMLFGEFLRKNKEGHRYDFFMTLDDDVSFDPSAIDRLIEKMSRIEVSAICLPYAFKAAVGHPKHRLSVCRFHDEPVDSDDGLVIGKYGNGGAMIMREDLLYEMIMKYPDLSVRWNSAAEGREVPDSYALWLPMVNGWELLSEDYAFSERLIRMGNRVWFDLYTPTTHWNGATPYRLDYTNVPSR